MSTMLLTDYQKRKVEVYLCHDDLPDDVQWSDVVALDAEFTGLNIHYDYLCLVQLRLRADGPIYLIKFADRQFHAPNLCRLLRDKDTIKIGHFISSDLMYLYQAFRVIAENVWCTYVASKLSRGYSSQHGLLNLCLDVLSVDISKAERSTDWSVKNLTEAQKRYAATDVLYLHELRDKLSKIIEKRSGWCIFDSVMKIIPHQALLECTGFSNIIRRFD